MQNTAAELAKYRQTITGILAKWQDRLLITADNGWDKCLWSHLGFDQWLAETERLSGIQAYCSEQQYRDYYRQGRIDDSDIGAALTGHDALHAGKPPAAATREAIYRAVLIYGLPLANADQGQVISPMQNSLPAAIRREFPAVGSDHKADAARQLWCTIADKLRVKPPPIAETPEAPLQTEPPCPHELTRGQAGLEFDLFMAGLGESASLRDFVQALSGVDILDNVRPQLLRVINSALDQGVATWRLPETGRADLYNAWRATLPFDANLFLHQLPDWQDIVTELPEQAIDCISLQLLKLGIPVCRWQTYLQRLLMELPGCSQLIAGYAGRQQDRPVSLADYLSIRLVLDRLWLNQTCQDLWQIEAKTSALITYFHKNLSEFFVRKHLYQGQLPEHLATLAETLIIRAGSERQCRSDWQRLADLLYDWRFSANAKPGSDTLAEPSWRLSLLCQHLGFDSQRVGQLKPNDLWAMLKLADDFDAREQGKIWLHALEHHYRQQLLGCLQTNLQKTKKHPISRPIAQVVFCMDPREESARHHLEQLGTTIETFGTRGFITNKDVSLDYDGQAQTRPKSFAHRLLQMDLAWSFIAINGYAPIAMLDLLGKSLWPETRQRLLEKWPDKDKRAGHETTPALAADTQAGLAAGFLLDIGLTGEFSDWVVLMGHSPPNEPGEYLRPWCQACNGRNSGHNAERLADILNRPQIRPLLKGYGIDIPEQTRFIAAGHGQDGQLRWLPSHRPPEPPALGQLQSLLQQALTGSEKFTRQRTGFAHHSGHAALIIARRQITEGWSLEQRVFLLSYAPDRDLNGERLEKILLAELPGLIGMNLDYYCASVKHSHHANGCNRYDNPVGFFTLMSGTDSDYRTGFSRQELERHEAMRMTIVVETEAAVMAAMLERNPGLNNLFAGSWAYLAVIDPKNGHISAYKPGAGFPL